MARGKYISRMDADDIAFPNLLEKQFQIFRENTTIDIVNIQTYLMSNDGKSYRKSRTAIKVHSDVHLHVVFFQNLISHPGVMLKASLLKKHLYNENMVDLPFEDVDLWHRLLREGAQCFTTDDFLLFYRNNSTGITNTKRKSILSKRVEYCKDILIKNYNDNFFSDKEIELMIGKYQETTFKNLINLERNLNNYIDYVIHHNDIAPSGVDDLFFWKDHMLFTISFKTLLISSFKNKSSILLFILMQSYFWIKNRKWRMNFFEIIKPTRKVKRFALN